MIAESTSVELREVSLFNNLPDDDLQYVAEHVHRTTVPPGTILVNALLPGEAIYCILDGSVKVQLTSEEGTDVITALLGPGDVVGETMLVEGRRRAVNAITRQETTVLWMDRKSFLKCIDLCPSLCRNLARELSEHLLTALERIQAFATLDVTGRLALQLLEMMERYGRPKPGEGIVLSMPVTQGELAEIVAATRERVNQIMVRLRRKGVFSVDERHRLTVHDPDVLAELSRF